MNNLVGATCARCLLSEFDPRWIWAYVADDVWATLIGKTDGSGYLCLDCIDSIAIEKGVQSYKVYIIPRISFLKSKQEQEQEIEILSSKLIAGRSVSFYPDRLGVGLDE